MADLAQATPKEPLSFLATAGYFLAGVLGIIIVGAIGSWCFYFQPQAKVINDTDDRKAYCRQGSIGVIWVVPGKSATASENHCQVFWVGTPDRYFGCLTIPPIHERKTLRVSQAKTDVPKENCDLDRP